LCLVSGYARAKMSMNGLVRVFYLRCSNMRNAALQWLHLRWNLCALLSRYRMGGGAKQSDFVHVHYQPRVLRAAAYGTGAYCHSRGPDSALRDPPCQYRGRNHAIVMVSPPILPAARRGRVVEILDTSRAPWRQRRV